MGVTNWQEIYSSYSDAELVTELAELKKISNFSSQTIGGKSYTVDPGAIADKLQAAVREQKRRASATGTGRGAWVGVVDLSAGVNGSGGLEG